MLASKCSICKRIVFSDKPRIWQRRNSSLDAKRKSEHRSFESSPQRFTRHPEQFLDIGGKLIPVFLYFLAILIQAEDIAGGGFRVVLVLDWSPEVALVRIQERDPRPAEDARKIWEQEETSEIGMPRRRSGFGKIPNANSLVTFFSTRNVKFLT